MSSVIRNFIVTFCASLLIFGIIAYVIITNINSIFGIGKPVSSENPKDNSTEVSDNLNGDNNNNPEGNNGSSTSYSEDNFTILLVGTDYQPDVHTDYDVTEMNKLVSGFPIKAREVSADSILLIRADAKKKIFMFSSLPSNMRVTVDGGETTLGRVYSKKGIEYMSSLITALTGMPIDYYASLSLSNFISLIDDLGGITFTVPTNMYYQDPSQGLEINMLAGNQTLSGKQASDMLRYVSYSSEAENSRRSLAISFAKSLLKKFAIPSNMVLASEFYSNYAHYAETNFTITDLTRHLELIFAYGDFTSIDLSYPGIIENDGGSITFIPDLNSAITLYKDYR